MPLEELVLEEQRLKDSVSYLARQIADMEKRKNEIEAIIVSRYKAEEDAIQEKWTQILKMENEVKAISLTAKIHIDQFSKNLARARTQQLMEDKRLAEREARLSKAQKEVLENSSKAVSDAKRTEEVKAEAEKAAVEIKKGLKEIEDKKQEVELRMQSLAIMQDEAFAMQKDMERGLKDAAEREERSRTAEMKAIAEQKKAMDAAKDLEVKRAEILALQGKIDAQMEQAREIVDRMNAQSKQLEKDRAEVKAMRQTLMDRMISLDKRETLLKQREGGK